MDNDASLAFVVGSGLFLLYFILGKNYSKVKLAPGWNNLSKSAEQLEGDLYQVILKEHQGGLCPVRAFWWKGEQVVSICSPKAYRDTENLYNRPLNFFQKHRLHGVRGLQNLNYGLWLDRKSHLHKCVRGDNLKLFHPVFVKLSREVVKRWILKEKVDVIDEMYRFFMNVIVTTLYGHVFEDEQELEELMKLYENCKIKEEAKYGSNDKPTSHEDPCFQQKFENVA